MAWNRDGDFSAAWACVPGIRDRLAALDEAANKRLDRELEIEAAKTEAMKKAALARLATCGCQEPSHGHDLACGKRYDPQPCGAVFRVCWRCRPKRGTPHGPTGPRG